MRGGIDEWPLADAEAVTQVDRVVAGWVVECRGRMEALARHLVDDPDLADDMVQEAVIAAIESGRADPEHVANVRDPCGWLVGIVRYVALQWLRKVARRSRLLSRNELEIYEMLFPEMEDDSDWDVDRLGQQEVWAKSV